MFILFVDAIFISFIFIFFLHGFIDKLCLSNFIAFEFIIELLHGARINHDEKRSKHQKIEKIVHQYIIIIDI